MLVDDAAAIGRRVGVPKSARRKPAKSGISGAQRRQLRTERLIRNAHRLPSDLPKLAARVERDHRQLQALLTRRWHDYRQACMQHPDLLPQQAWNTIAAIPVVDAALSRLGTGWPQQAEVETLGSWPEHLRWAADGVANIARLCRYGQTYGAIVLARTQLERWTINVASRFDVEQVPGESTGDWIERAWGNYDADHAAKAKRSWESLSEWLHGRGIMPSACSTAWTQLDPNGDLPAELTSVLAQVWETTDLAFLQARGGTWYLVNAPETANISDPADPLLQHLPSPDEPGEYAILQADWSLPGYEERDTFALTTVPVDMIMPFTPFADDLVREARSYRRYLTSRRAQDDAQSSVNPRLGEDAVRERRARAVETARKAFSIEQDVLGDEFSPGALGAKLFRFAAIAHAARLTAEWTVDCDRDALLVAASALDSGWVLWLEDTDQALTCVRGLVEQTARARCWRVKTAAAQKLESAKSPPSRWVEKAGWRRLSVLVKALGEFAHTTARSDWDSARATLVAHNDGPYDLVATARGNVLNAAAYMLASEVAERLRGQDPRLVHGFQEAVTLIDDADHAAMLEDLLERGLAARLAAADANLSDTSG